MNIEGYIEQFTSLWEQANIDFPFAGKGVSPFEKSNNEKSMIAFSASLKKEINIKGIDKEAKNRLVQQVNSNTGVFFKNALKKSPDAAVKAFLVLSGYQQDCGNSSVPELSVFCVITDLDSSCFLSTVEFSSCSLSSSSSQS